ncbi:hypothetical protein K1719_018597 [Acacia pycnantha]|nr:hypothetical protein K1719_018597 [Acacia pycnantha]
MSSTSRAWVVATSVGVVESLKVQGVCKWNYLLRSVQQHLKNQSGFVSQANNLSSSSASAMASKIIQAPQDRTI